MKMKAYKGEYNIKIVKFGYKDLIKKIILRNNNTQLYFELQKDDSIKPNNRVYIRSVVFDRLIKKEKGFRISAIATYERFIFTFGPGDISASINIGAYSINRENDVKFLDSINKTNKEINIIPIFLGTKYTFFRDLHYIQPFIGLNGGVGFLSIHQDRYQYGIPYFSALCGISFHFDAFYIMSDVQYLDMGKAKIKELNEITPFGNNIYEEKEIFIGGISIEIGTGIEF